MLLPRYWQCSSTPGWLNPSARQAAALMHAARSAASCALSMHVSWEVQLPACAALYCAVCIRRAPCSSRGHLFLCVAGMWSSQVVYRQLHAACCLLHALPIWLCGCTGRRFGCGYTLPASFEIWLCLEFVNLRYCSKALAVATEASTNLLHCRYGLLSVTVKGVISCI